LEKKIILLFGGHDLVDIMKELKVKITFPQSIENYCKILNLYYITTRYPDAFISGYPSEKFSQNLTEDAIKYAEEVIEFAIKKIT
jgi:HEPN domain-containing protein